MEYIRAAVQSALGQNVSREIIVVDDASTDGTVDSVISFVNENYIVDECGIIPEKSAKDVSAAVSNTGRSIRQDKRFDNVNVVADMRVKMPKREGVHKEDTFEPCNMYIIKNRKNYGVAYSRNRGVRVARGKYVAFLDADDWWREDKLKKQLALIEKAGSFLCTTDRELVMGSKPSGAVVKSPAYITFSKLRRSNWINCSAVLVRRNALARFPMEQGYIHEDYLCWLNIVREYGPAVNVSEPLLLYRVRLKSKSGNKLRSLKLSFNTYRKFGYGFFKSVIYVIENAAAGFVKFGRSFIKSKKE
jgi:teichuronic acid biosynthesis glycosyltransferase TuaG